MAKVEVKQKGFFDKAMDFIEKSAMLCRTLSACSLFWLLWL